MKDEFKALIFQPKNKPESLLRYLIKEFKNIKIINEAYFCCFQRAELNENPFIAIGIVSSCERAEVDKELYPVLKSSGFPNIVVVNALEKPFSTHFKDIEPFYTKMT